MPPGQSLGIASVPNLRNLGGYKTENGATVARGLVYRSNELHNITVSDMALLAKLNLKTAFDLRTSAEREISLDELPAGVNSVWLNVMADIPGAGAGDLSELLADPAKANRDLGNGKAEALFSRAYRQSVSLPSSKIAYRQLFLSLGDKNNLPALFHCASGKDRTGWAAAALLTILGVPMETVKKDYLRSNEYILPQYEKATREFIAAGGSPSIPSAIFGVKEEYLDAAFDEMTIQYGSIENYFTEGLGISAAQQTALREVFLAK